MVLPAPCHLELDFRKFDDFRDFWKIFLEFFKKNFSRKKIFQNLTKIGENLIKKVGPLIFFSDISTPFLKDILVEILKMAFFEKKNDRSGLHGKSEKCDFTTDLKKTQKKHDF